MCPWLLVLLQGEAGRSGALRIWIPLLRTEGLLRPNPSARVTGSLSILNQRTRGIYLLLVPLCFIHRWTFEFLFKNSFERVVCQAHPIAWFKKWSSLIFNVAISVPTNVDYTQHVNKNYFIHISAKKCLVNTTTRAAFSCNDYISVYLNSGFQMSLLSIAAVIWLDMVLSMINFIVSRYNS